MKNTLTICLLLVCSFFALTTQASISSVPTIMAAPVVLYDEANNVLADGTYTVAISLYDITDTAVYAEEQSVAVNNGVAMLTIGQGYTVGSGLSSPAGGLSWNVFDVTGDVTVEILVEGQASPQMMTVLGSQPYAFISQYAINVTDNSVTTDKIQDGTITQADLDEGLLEMLQSGGDGTSSSSSSSGVENLTAENVAVSSTIGLNNASGSNVEEVLQGLDTAIDLLRGTHLEQGLEGVQSDVSSINSTISNLDATYATDAALSSAVSSINSTISSLDSTYATDADLSSVSSSLSSLSSTVATNSSNISILQTNVANLEIAVDELDDPFDPAVIPQSLKPFAYGTATISSTSGNIGTCSGYNINSSVTGACQFATAAANTSYSVQLTASGSYDCTSDAATSVEYVLYSSKTSASQFRIYSHCSGGDSSPATVDFLVFSNQ